MKVAADFNPNNLIEEIKDQVNMSSVGVVEMKTRNLEQPSVSYLIWFKNDANINVIKNITGLNNIRVKWEQYSRKMRVSQVSKILARKTLLKYQTEVC